MKHLAIDPGGTTGYALYNDLGLGKITIGDFKDSTEFARLIVKGVVVIYEMPFFTPTVNPIVFEVKGALLYAARTKANKVYDQPAYIPKHIWNRYKLQGLIWGSQHEKDAFCHLLHYMVTRLNFTGPQVVEIYQQTQERIKNVSNSTSSG